MPLKEKAKILRNNIFGVDIDPQAVEITMMSLYLKALEGERGMLPRKQHLLPPLGNNIKCGNSLIGYDMFDSPQQYSLPNVIPAKAGIQEKNEDTGFRVRPGMTTRMEWTDEDRARINPFDWNSKTTGFSDIMESGGFDAVIGNPPYVRQELLGDFKDYFQQHYEVYHGTADLYAYFIEKGVSLLKKDGLFSYIVANKWLRAGYGEPLRRWMKKQRIEEITDFGDLPVFETATTYPCILRIRKGSAASKFSATQVKTLDFSNLSDYVSGNSYDVNKTVLNDEGWSLVNEQSQALLDKMRSMGKPLGEYVNGVIYRGILAGFDEAFIIDEKTKKKLIAEDKKSAELIKPYVMGRDIKRYQLVNSKRYIIFTRRGINIKDYPAIQNYLSSFKDKLMPKPKDWKGSEWKGRKPGTYKWYEIQDAVDYFAEFEKPKLTYLKFQVRPAFVIDYEGFYPNSAVWAIPGNDLYLLGILNSKLGWYLISNYCTQIQNGYQLIFKYLGQIPIHTIDFNSPSEKAIHDKLVSLVDRMLDLHKKKAALPPSAEREKIEREIAVTDEKIDEIVYGLYGITDTERQIIGRE